MGCCFFFLVTFSDLKNYIFDLPSSAILCLRRWRWWDWVDVVGENIPDWRNSLHDEDSWGSVWWWQWWRGVEDMRVMKTINRILWRQYIFAGDSLVSLQIRLIRVRVSYWCDWLSSFINIGESSFMKRNPH